MRPGLPLLSLWLLACSAQPLPPAIPATAAPSAAPPHAGSQAPAPCPATPQQVGRIADIRLDEVSGIVESRSAPGVFFVHNDSGDSPRFFAIDRQGALLAELVLTSVPTMLDAEDIASGPAPDGSTFLYLGDTGNNFASMGLGIPRRKAVLYRMPEPSLSVTARGLKLEMHNVFPIVLTFPEGARDIEAFFIDPQTGDLFMLGKQQDGHSPILTLSAVKLAQGGGELYLAGVMSFGMGFLTGSTMPTAASMARDGSAILIRTYNSVFLFRREGAEPIMRAFSRAPLRLPSAEEQQGEAISFAEGTQAFITISEGMKPPINCTHIPAP